LQGARCRDRGFRFGGDRDHLLEVAVIDERHDLRPETAVVGRLHRQIDEALDRDRDADDEDRGERIKKESSFPEEIHNEVIKFHRR
jgi:hypothetical protein